MKKQIVKSLAILLIIAMMCAFIPVGKVEAANPTNPAFELVGGEGKAGDVVQVKLNLKEDTTFEDLTLGVYYDPSKLAVDSEENDIILSQDLTTNMIWGTTLEKEKRVEYQGIDMQADPFTVKAGTVMAINFRILEGATGDVDLTFKYDTTETQLATATVKIITPVESVSLDKTSLEMTKGETQNLVATVVPQEATDATVTWSSSNTNVATVENGVVTAVGGGTATITATAGGKSATCAVNVKSPMTGIALSETEVSLVKGQPKTLTVAFLPADTTDSKNVVWSTSDESVVSVDNGKLTGLKQGTATITATCGTLTATAEVTVVEYPLVGIIAWVSEEEIDIGEQIETIVATAPENTTDDVTFTFESSDENVATVDENGVITGVAQGEATITVTANDEFTSEFKITVTDKEYVPEEEEGTTEENGEGAIEEETETSSVLPKTADIAIGAVVLVMLVAGGVAIFTIKKNKRTK